MSWADLSPPFRSVTRSDTVDDPNGPFMAIRFDVAGRVDLISGGEEHTLTVLAGETLIGEITRVNLTSTVPIDSEMVGYKR